MMDFIPYFSLLRVTRKYCPAGSELRSKNFANFLFFLLLLANSCTSSDGKRCRKREISGH